MTTLYRAESTGSRSWATHAAAAAWLAHGHVEVDSDALAELIGAEFVGGERTLVRNAKAVPPAMRIDLEDGRASHATFWSIADRWAPVAPEHAYGHTATALLDGLSARLQGSMNVQLGMTAGLDSRVGAVALMELGVPFGGFTWGNASWEDVRGAAAVGEALGVPHRRMGITSEPDATSLPRVAQEVRWHEGTIPVGFNRSSWPAGMDICVYGSGGET